MAMEGGTAIESCSTGLISKFFAKCEVLITDDDFLFTSIMVIGYSNSTFSEFFGGSLSEGSSILISYYFSTTVVAAIGCSLTSEPENSLFSVGD